MTESPTLFSEKNVPPNRERTKGSSVLSIQKTAHELRDLWRCELDSFLTGEDTWAGRLIPLNKVSPTAPNRKQMRPILVQSAIVKLLEARFLPKLQDYMVNKLTPCQTGFIPQMGIQVNLALSHILFSSRNLGLKNFLKTKK